MTIKNYAWAKKKTTLNILKENEKEKNALCQSNI